MPYNFTEISDYDLKLFFAVINDLHHKAILMDATGPLKFNNTPKGVSRDEQMAILYRLDNDHYISFSNDSKSVWLNEKVYVGVSWSDVFQSVHKAHHERFEKPKAEKNLKPHYDEANGILYVQGFAVRIKRQNKDTYEHQILKHIFITNKDNIAKEFDYSVIPFDILEQKENIWSRCRTACLSINKKIKAKSNGTITDFLQFNSRIHGWLNINPKYLEV